MIETIFDSRFPGCKLTAVVAGLLALAAAMMSSTANRERGR